MPDTYSEIDQDEIVPNDIRRRLAAGEIVTIMAVRYIRTADIAQVARAAGFTSIYVDGEHASLTSADVAQICAAALASGISPFVRVPANNESIIAAALDGGAQGVIVPHVRNADDARAAVAAAKLPPLGTRSYSSLPPQLRYRSVPLSRAAPLLNEQTMVALMIEEAAAIESLDEILAVPGVDIALIGANDLTSSLGIPGQYEHSVALEAYAAVTAACARCGVTAGFAGASSLHGLVVDLIGQGVRFISSGTDIGFLIAGGKQWLDRLDDRMKRTGERSFDD